MVSWDDEFDYRTRKMRPRAVLTCDECGKECEELYQNDDGQFCSDCVLEMFTKIDAFELEEAAEEEADDQRWERDIVFASNQR